ncbi:MAG: trypsin-like peptidase domain-containing protein [Ilumatobacteraceae bacterium]
MLGLALLAAACGGGVDAKDLRDDEPTTIDPADEPTTSNPGVTLPDQPATTVAAPTTTTPADGLDTVRSATIQIVGQGTFVDPEFGVYEAAGRGSGFVIDPSGIAITNHHVVGGAGLIQVFVQGEDKPRNAKILGVSECSDLAVIDIDGDPLPSLSWFDGSVQPGLEVYAAGFPLGDPEFTLTRGIVSKADADGETNWASVDHVIEHDANTQPGNSGGPLVSADGRIVAINYAAAVAPTPISSSRSRRATPSRSSSNCVLAAMSTRSASTARSCAARTARSLASGCRASRRAHRPTWPGSCPATSSPASRVSPSASTAPCPTTAT